MALPRVCRTCGETDMSKLVKNPKEKTGRERRCRKCQASDRKRSLNGIAPPLVRHNIPCRNGCKATIPVYVQPGVTPSKFQYCANCQKKAAGLGHGIYPDHGTNAD